ncbi:hypothetical protein C8Q73DRAFT_295933 [Cubamyces lactineus]|nr:hypothetical protein C8Q73DRAFT_295933 [Cubamyces lactineus]
MHWGPPRALLLVPILYTGHTTCLSRSTSDPSLPLCSSRIRCSGRFRTFVIRLFCAVYTYLAPASPPFTPPPTLARRPVLDFFVHISYTSHLCFVLQMYYHSQP